MPNTKSTPISSVRRMADIVNEASGGGGGGKKGKKNLSPKKRLKALKGKEIARPNGKIHYPTFRFGQIDFELLRIAREAGKNVVLSGPPGTGKTSLMEAAYGEDLITFNGSSHTQVSDLMGSWIPNISEEDETQAASDSIDWRWEMGPVPLAMAQGTPLFIDDFTQIPPGVLTRIFSAIDGRGVIQLPEYKAGFEVKAEDGFILVAAHNPKAYGAIFDDPMKSRFNIKLTLDSRFEELADEDRLNFSPKSVDLATKLAAKHKADEIDWCPEIRDIENLNDNEELFNTDFALRVLLESVGSDKERAEVKQEVETIYGFSISSN